jgi:ectoine hydroxylase-related dioxygenase (phytanoyl-CoA dioxygenase family)
VTARSGVLGHVTAGAPGWVEAASQAIERDGCVIVRDVIDHGTCRQLVTEIERVEAEHDVTVGTNDFEGFQTTRIFNVLAKSALLATAPVHPGVLPLVESLLDPGLLLSGMTSIAIGPGETPQLLHSDDGMITLPRPHPATMITTMWALTDFTEANGATRVVPGSHLSPKQPKPGEHHETVAAEMSRGSVLVLHASLWHGGGANTTDERRFGLSVQYVAGWCRQQQNLMLGLDRELVAAMPRRLQELIGYSIYRAVMGHVDRRHPSFLLGTERPLGMIWDELGGAGTAPGTSDGPRR